MRKSNGAITRSFRWIPRLCLSRRRTRKIDVFRHRDPRDPSRPLATRVGAPKRHTRAVLLQIAVEKLQHHFIHLARGGAGNTVALLRVEHELELLAGKLQ